MTNPNDLKLICMVMLLAGCIFFASLGAWLTKKSVQHNGDEGMAAGAILSFLAVGGLLVIACQVAGVLLK